MAMVAQHPDPASADHAPNAAREKPVAGTARDETQARSGREAMAAFVPLCQRESASAYGLRAAGEILCRYLKDEEDRSPPDACARTAMPSPKALAGMPMDRHGPKAAGRAAETFGGIAFRVDATADHLQHPGALDREDGRPGHRHPLSPRSPINARPSGHS